VIPFLSYLFSASIFPLSRTVDSTSPSNPTRSLSSLALTATQSLVETAIIKMAYSSHITKLPPGFIALRILQLVVALAIFGLCIYAMLVFQFDGLGLGLFTVSLLHLSIPYFQKLTITSQSLATIIIVIYMIVAEHGALVIYNYWAFIGLEIFAIVFWLIAFAVIAADIVTIINYAICVEMGYCYDKKKRDGQLDKRIYTTVAIYYNLVCAMEGLGALELYVLLPSHFTQNHRRIRLTIEKASSSSSA
jgi:hypothetical protein